MDSMDVFLVWLGGAVVLFYAVKLLLFLRMFCPRLWFPLEESFFTSMGEWAVVTGASEGIGRAYAIELASRGMNVVILSRNHDKLTQAAKEIEEATGQAVKVIVADFTQDNVYVDIQEKLMDLDIGVLVNNVGILPSRVPCKFLHTEDLEQTITKVINCNVKAMVKMCQIVLPAMEKRGKGLILNVSSGMASVPFPIYTMYGASKLFVERFSQGLQAEYEAKGVRIQAVTPYGVSTPMTGYIPPNMVTLTAHDFVQTSLTYLKAGDKTYGSIRHTVLAWLIKTVPRQLLHSEAMQAGLIEFVRRKLGS